jgi:hypothetical protein
MSSVSNFIEIRSVVSVMKDMEGRELPNVQDVSKSFRTSRLVREL